MRILIADDDATSLLLLSATLKKLGHEAFGCANGEQAWQAWQGGHFPVLISDWVMPKMDGLELCRQIRRAACDAYTNIILLTALGGKANYLEAMNAGADDFITKPFDEEQLAARLAVAQRQLGLHRHLKQLEGLLPICGYCKRIRDDAAQWNSIETYVTRHSEARFSHGICPECQQQVLSELQGLGRPGG